MIGGCSGRARVNGMMDGGLGINEWSDGQPIDMEMTAEALCPRVHARMCTPAGEPDIGRQVGRWVGSGRPEGKFNKLCRKVGRKAGGQECSR